MVIFIISYVIVNYDNLPRPFCCGSFSQTLWPMTIGGFAQGIDSPGLLLWLRGKAQASKRVAERIVWDVFFTWFPKRIEKREWLLQITARCWTKTCFIVHFLYGIIIIPLTFMRFMVKTTNQMMFPHQFPGGSSATRDAEFLIKQPVRTAPLEEVLEFIRGFSVCYFSLILHNHSSEQIIRL